MNLLVQLLETAETADFMSKLVGKSLKFKDPKLKMDIEFKIEKVERKTHMSSRGSLNLDLTLKGLNAKRNLNRDAMSGEGDPDAGKIKAALGRGHIHGEAVPPALMKTYMEKYFHPYGDPGIIESLQKLIGDKAKVSWSENGLQGANHINVDVELDSHLKDMK